MKLPTEPAPTPITAARLHAAAVLVGGGASHSFAEFCRGMALLGQPVTPTEALLLLGDADGALAWAALAERWSDTPAAPTKGELQ